MLRSTLNLGILAHVDAGKTTLSERLLYEAGVIARPGRVDDGTTQTDSLALEQQRGITIRSAVVSLAIGGTSVNLIDTPGHPDFIAEVDRVLGVLDGAILVVSAVEGVQPQTRVLMRALHRLRVPTLVFVNKIDRGGADFARTVEQIRRRLGVTAIPMCRVAGAGARSAQALARKMSDDGLRTGLIEALSLRDDDLLASYVEDKGGVTDGRLQAELAAQTGKALVCPVFAGSATTGAGVGALMDGVATLLPAATGDTAGPLSAAIFKIERGAAGEKVAYVRMFSGTIRTRDRVGGGGDKVTAISVFSGGTWKRRDSVSAGEVGKLWGLAGMKVGQSLGQGRSAGAGHRFALPALEAAITPVDAADHTALRSALAQLAEQDPLINVRSGDAGNDLAVSLYGEVQKEVIQATLAADFGVRVRFSGTTTLYLERPAGSGEAVKLLNASDNPLRATIGLRVEPAAPGSGVEFRLRVDFRAVPLFVYGNLQAFAASMEQYVRHALAEGLYGWPVSDCVVTMTESNYSSADGPPSTRGPLSTAADFRKLTPIVLKRALEQAGTVVCEPLSRVRVEAPAGTVGPVLRALGKLGAAIEQQAIRGGDVTIEALLPAAVVHRLQGKLPNLTGGEGVLEASPGGYRKVDRRDPPRRSAGG